jgi:transposase
VNQSGARGPISRSGTVATSTPVSVSVSQQSGQQVEVDEHEQIVERVAAIDVAKASGMVCTRAPHPAAVGKRITTVWQVPSMTNQILELAEQLAGQGIERVVVESTSDDWRPLV